MRTLGYFFLKKISDCLKLFQNKILKIYHKTYAVFELEENMQKDALFLIGQMEKLSERRPRA